MVTDILALLVASCLAATGASVLVLALRWALRRLFGAGTAYFAWLIVPSTVGAALLPPIVAAHRPPVVILVQASARNAVSAAASPGVWWPQILLMTWLAGVGVLVLLFWHGHRKFIRQLGELIQRDGVFFSRSPRSGPALVGLWRPKIVLPADFAGRYSEQEQVLVIAHERVHARRGDLVANLVQAALQCIFWFNPLVHVAARYFRMDQEMACDAAVLRGSPNAVRTYAQALFKSQSFPHAVSATVACTWRFNHPVKERFMNLQQTQPGSLRHLIGRLIVACSLLAAGYAAVAARADDIPGPTVYDVALTLKVNGVESSPRVMARSGEPFAVEVTDAIRVQFVISPVSLQEKTIRLAGTLTDGAGNAMHPVLIGRLGQHLGISGEFRDAKTESGGYDIRMVVQEAAPATPKTPR
jgi:beta-lactamase regulating signal transducer with metallopeptidase domain